MERVREKDAERIEAYLIQTYALIYYRCEARVNNSKTWKKLYFYSTLEWSVATNVAQGYSAG